MPSSNSKLQTFLSDLRDARIALSAVAEKAKSAHSALQEQILDCDTIVSALPAASLAVLEVLEDELDNLLDLEFMADEVTDIEENFRRLMKSTDPILQAVLASLFEDQNTKPEAQKTESE